MVILKFIILTDYYFSCYIQIWSTNDIINSLDALDIDNYQDKVIGSCSNAHTKRMFKFESLSLSGIFI